MRRREFGFLRLFSTIIRFREEQVARKELAWWDDPLLHALESRSLNISWKPIPRIHPHIFDIDNMVAIRLVGCGLTGVFGSPRESGLASPLARPRRFP